MRVANLFLQHLDKSGAAYEPYHFRGSDWTRAEKSAVVNEIKKHVPEKVTATFNEWTFSKYGKNVYSASRATWDIDGINCKNVGELVEGIARYYNP